MLPRKVGSWIMTARSSVIGMQLDEVVSVVCFSGILEKHPGLNIVLGESGLGWIPYVLEQMDKKYRDYETNTRDYRDYRGVYAIAKTRRPSSSAVAGLRKLTFEDEDLGVDMIPLIGACGQLPTKGVMWAAPTTPTRYHPVSTWPNSMDFISSSEAPASSPT